jgi:predicted HTH domain antitoxin
MNISIEVPDEIAYQIESRWSDLPRRTLEALVTYAVREDVISGPQAQKMLGLGSRLELDAFLKRSNVCLDYDENDLESDIRALDELLGE